MSKISHKTSKAILALLPVVAGAITPASATDFTARVVMEKMPAEQRFPFISGIIEGTAYARYLRDDKRTDGMLCIYNWFYQDPKAIELIYAALDKFGDYTPGAVVGTLADQHCEAK